MQFYWFFRLFWLAVWGCARFSGVSMSKSVWSKNQNRELVTCHYNLAEKLLFTQMQKRYTEDRVLCSFFKQRNRRNHMIFSFGSGYLRTSNKCTQKKKKNKEKKKPRMCGGCVAAMFIWEVQQQPKKYKNRNENCIWDDFEKRESRNGERHLRRQRKARDLTPWKPSPLLAHTRCRVYLAESVCIISIPRVEAPLLNYFSIYRHLSYLAYLFE